MVVLSFRTDRRPSCWTSWPATSSSAGGRPGCRNIDLAASVTDPGRVLVVEKWDSADDQRAHFDSDEMVAMAQSRRAPARRRARHRPLRGRLDARPGLSHPGAPPAKLRGSAHRFGG